MASKEISKLLKDLRIAAGYSQKEVYDNFHIPQSTFNAWEIGRAEPSCEMFVQLCDFYKHDLVGINRDEMISPPELEILEKYRTLDQTGKETIQFILDKQCDRVTHENKLVEIVEEALGPHPYEGPGADAVRKVAEKNTARYLEKLAAELNILQAAKDQNNSRK